MKRFFLLLLSIFAALLLFSCEQKCSAEGLIEEFLYSYGASGVVYSSESTEGEDGYLEDGMTEKIFVYDGDFPENYALLLNFHTDYGAECGVFVCDGADERARVVDMCEERVALLSRGGENGAIICADNIVFYSTLQDKARVVSVWNKIIRAHT